MSDGIHGHGTTLAIGAATIGNITSISGPSQARDSIDISTMDSSDKWREFIPGMLDAGEVTFDVNYDATAGETADDLQAAIDDDPADITITLPDTSTFVCSGIVTGVGFAIPFDDKVTQSVTIKLTGAPTFTDVA